MLDFLPLLGQVIAGATGAKDLGAETGCFSVEADCFGVANPRRWRLRFADWRKEQFSLSLQFWLAAEGTDLTSLVLPWEL